MFIFHAIFTCSGDVLARKVVQTDLDDDEYRLLKEVVEKRGITLKSGLREAVRQWVSAQIPVSEDPLFRVEPVSTGVKTDASNLDRRLYGERPG
jgi:hypothetical protein